jgi:hypothetical protein
MTNPLGKTSGTVLGFNGATFPRRERGSVVRENPHHATEARLGRKQLIRETQKIMLQFPIKEAAELQDTTERAVESQRNGESAVSLLAVANMCQASAKARALFAPLFGFTGHYTDPDFMEGLEKVMAGYLRQQMGQQPPAVAEPEQDLPELTPDLFAGRA